MQGIEATDAADKVSRGQIMNTNLSDNNNDGTVVSSLEIFAEGKRVGKKDRLPAPAYL